LRHVRIPTWKSIAVFAAVIAGCASVALPYSMAAEQGRGAHVHAVVTRSPYHSRELWATINVCSPKTQPYVVGIRGSMPGDGNAKDTMEMRFRLQFYEATGRKWVESPGSDSGLLPVGTASTTRQYGRSVTLMKPKESFKLRGLVSFEWLHGKRVVYSTERITTAGHKSASGANPPGYSAATCLVS
jgi:hypothetical protein